jgi:hypothetical protein
LKISGPVLSIRPFVGRRLRPRWFAEHFSLGFLDFDFSGARGFFTVFCDFELLWCSPFVDRFVDLEFLVVAVFWTFSAPAIWPWFLLERNSNQLTTTSALNLFFIIGVRRGVFVLSWRER